MEICETDIEWRARVSKDSKPVSITLVHPKDLKNVTGLISIGIGSSTTTAQHILSRLDRNDFAIAIWPFEAFPPDKKSLYFICEEAPVEVLAWFRRQGCSISRAIGHSQGANVLIAHVAKYPDSLKEIALMSPTLMPQKWPKFYAAARVIAGLTLNGMAFSFSRDREDKRTAREAKQYIMNELRQRTHGLHNRLSESFMNALDGDLSASAKKTLENGKPNLALFCGKIDFVASPRRIAHSLHIPRESIHILRGGHSSLSSVKGEVQLLEVLEYLDNTP